MILLQNPQPKAYRRLQIANGVSLYASGASKGKTLILGLCGGSDDLCAATALILQYFPDESYDFLVLRDVQRKGFTVGILGYGTSPQAAADRLKVDTDVTRYRDVRCFGVSAAGAAALLFGTMMNASRSVCIGGRPPTLSATSGQTEPARQLEDQLKSCINPGRALVVHTAGHAIDAENARRIAQLNGCFELFEVPGMAEHALIEPLDRQGRLRDFLRDVGLLD
jgi:hypothetical protein